MDGLFVRNRNDPQQNHDGKGDWKYNAKCHGTGCGKNDKYLLGSTSGGEKRVRGKNRKTNGFPDRFVRCICRG
jgi:hypothetical protein